MPECLYYSMDIDWRVSMEKSSMDTNRSLHEHLACWLVSTRRSNKAREHLRGDTHGWHLYWTALEN
jgi:hypothetical protein